MASLALSLALGAAQHEIEARAKAAEERAQQQASKQALRDEKEAEVSRIEMLRRRTRSDRVTANPGVVCERQCASEYHTTECATGFCGLGFCCRLGTKEPFCDGTIGCAKKHCCSRRRRRANAVRARVRTRAGRRNGQKKRRRTRPSPTKKCRSARL